jgi:NAD(P)-dependent dehydrogenase (short-subunit alcohol dehydrogenase family)
MIQMGAEYDTWEAYGQSKTAVILFTLALASRYAKEGITTLALHPAGK